MLKFRPPPLRLLPHFTLSTDFPPPRSPVGHFLSRINKWEKRKLRWNLFFVTPPPPPPSRCHRNRARDKEISPSPLFFSSLRIVSLLDKRKNRGQETMAPPTQFRNLPQKKLLFLRVPKTFIHQQWKLVSQKCFRGGRQTLGERNYKIKPFVYGHFVYLVSNLWVG